MHTVAPFGVDLTLGPVPRGFTNTLYSLSARAPPAKHCCKTAARPSSFKFLRRTPTPHVTPQPGASASSAAERTSSGISRGSNRQKRLWNGDL
jgi:hypothetical protein